MQWRSFLTTRNVSIAVLALLILLGLVLATGGGTGAGTSAPPTPVPPVLELNTLPPAHAQGVQGTVAVALRQLPPHGWRFRYTVHNTGAVPIAGFEINAGRSNLYHLSAPSGWSDYGTGVCGGNHPGILVYWSTNQNGAATLGPGRSAVFAFSVNTRAIGSASYSLSWSTAAPQFGMLRAPAPSSLAASGPC